MDRPAPTILIIQLAAWWKTVLLSWKHFLFTGTQHNICRTILWTDYLPCTKGALHFMHVFVRIHLTREKLFYFLVAKSLRMTHILSINFFRGIFLDFLYYQKLLHLLPLRFHSVRGFGIEPRTVATSPLKVRRSNYTRLDLIHKNLKICTKLMSRESREKKTKCG